MHNYTYINNYMNLFGVKTRHSLQAQKNISILVENIMEFLAEEKIDMDI